MSDRQSSRQEASGASPHKGRFWPRRGREARRNAAAHAGMPRLGVDLRAQQSGPMRNDLAPTLKPRVTPITWRLAWPRKRSASSPAAPASYARQAPTRSAPSRRLGLRSILLVVLAVQIILAVAAVWMANSWQVRHLRIQGATDATVARAIARLPLTGCVIFRCDLVRYAALINALPAVTHATVTATFPDTLVVSVTLRTPALTWATDAGSVVLATDGVVLGPLDSDPTYAALHLPTIADAPAAAFGGAQPAAGATLDAGLVDMAAQLRSGLTTSLGADWTLTYAADTGLTAVSTSGARIAFGDARAAAALVTDDASAQTLGSPPALATVEQGARLQLGAAKQILQQLANRRQAASLIDLRWGSYPYYILTSG